MKKKIISILASSAIIGTMACASAVSTSAFSGEITFEIPENWVERNETLYAHIWDGTPGGSGLYGWQTEHEKMTISADKKTATYEVPEGTWNLIIISGNSGVQTYDSVFNANCIGDTCYVTPYMYESPVDSARGSYALTWVNNPDCGAHKIVTSLGNVTGESFIPGETNQTIFDDFVRKYNPQNGIDGIVDYDCYFDWNDDGAIVTGMSWEEVKNKVACELGVTITEEPTEEPTEAPTAEATQAPTTAPTAAPTQAPTQAPTKAPSSNNSNGTVNTAQGAMLATLAATLFASLGVVYVIGKKRANSK